MRPDAKTWLLILAVVAFLGLFFFYPILSVFESAVWESTGPTFHYIGNALGSPSIQAGFLNALKLAVISTILASLLAVPLAYLQARMDFFGKRFFAAGVLVPMILPPFVGAIGLKQVLGPYGALNAALAGLGLVDPSQAVDWFRVYPLVGVVALQALHLYPILYLNMVAGLSNVDPSLEDAARGLGASPWRVFRRVTFPLVLPSYFAGAVIVFIWALTDLGTPLMFNFREVIAVQIFDTISQPSSPDANALVLLLLGVVALLYWGARLALGREAFGMMSVATRAPTPVPLGRAATAGGVGPLRRRPRPGAPAAHLGHPLQPQDRVAEHRAAGGPDARTSPGGAGP